MLRILHENLAPFHCVRSGRTPRITRCAKVFSRYCKRRCQVERKGNCFLAGELCRQLREELKSRRARNRSWSLFCGSGVKKVHFLSHCTRSIRVRFARRGAFPQSLLFFKFSLYGNGLSRTGFKSNINNCTFEKITFENVGNLICPDSCLTSTSSRRSPEGKHWLNLTVSLWSNATIATKVSCKHWLVKTIGGGGGGGGGQSPKLKNQNLFKYHSSKSYQTGIECS